MHTYITSLTRKQETWNYHYMLMRMTTINFNLEQSFSKKKQNYSKQLVVFSHFFSFLFFFLVFKTFYQSIEKYVIYKSEWPKKHNPLKIKLVNWTPSTLKLLVFGHFLTLTISMQFSCTLKIQSDYYFLSLVVLHKNAAFWLCY